MPLGLKPGDTFAERYRVVRRIASGAMGEVYEVVQTATGHRRALKVMLPHVVEGLRGRERFHLEARIAAHIDSKYIVNVSDAGVDAESDTPFLVMELLEGEELGKRLKRKGRFSPEETLLYLHQTALALDKTHEATIIHRDLKPENLFLTQASSGPRIKVLDFGVAKFLAEGSTMGTSSASVGTPLYMAPEQFQNDVKVSPAADIYALGMMAYAFLVGEAYWTPEMRSGGNIVSLALSALHGPQEAASKRAARRDLVLPPGFDAWFAKATSVRPAERFGKATLAVAALAEVLELPVPVNAQPGTSDTISAVRSSSELVPGAAALTVGGALGSAPARRGALVAVALAMALVAVVLVTRLLPGSGGGPPRPDAAAADPPRSAAAPPSPPARVEPVQPSPPQPLATVIAAPSASPPPLPGAAAPAVARPAGTAKKPPAARPAAPTYSQD